MPSRRCTGSGAQFANGFLETGGGSVCQAGVREASGSCTTLKHMYLLFVFSCFFSFAKCVSDINLHVLLEICFDFLTICKRAWNTE